MFYKRSNLKIISTCVTDVIQKKIALKDAFGISEIKFTEILNEISDLYKISFKPGDFVFVVVHAITVNTPNENKDCFGEYELLSIKTDGRFTYETFNGVPLLWEHQDRDITQSSGLVIDSYYDDNIQDEKKVMTLVAVDMVKNRKLSSNLLNGRVQSFSMGCMCEQTRCSICNNVALRPEEFCNHIRDKMFISMVDGKSVFEWCEKVMYKELSHVSTPADLNSHSIEIINGGIQNAE